MALKVLPEAFTSDPDRLARFEREAKVLASLNHPNIGSIYGLEEQAGIRALVLELVEGPTLADRIKQGPIPIDEALPIAKQIAEALEAAHEQGVIHRDLKPANIKVKDNGTVKVLDFGLAKAFAGEAPDADLSQSPTVTASGTREGVILGTAAYMSPEQARGKPLDKRTDIWAFGCVLYEMLTGRLVFGGETLSDTIANVLDRQPEWNALPARTPPAVRKLLRRCVDKNPKNRLQHIGDARIELQETVSAPHDNESVAVSTGAVAGRRNLAWAAAVALTGIMAGLAGWTLSLTTTPRTSDAFVVLLPAETDLYRSARGDQGVAAMSPDGEHLVYVAERDGTRELYHRPMAQVEAVPLSGTEGAVSPFFSPDGHWVAFQVGNVLKKVSLADGTVLPICTFPDDDIVGSGGSWGNDETIWIGGVRTGLYRVAAGGGTPEQVTTPDSQTGVVGHYAPQVLPGGRAVLYTAFAGPQAPASVVLYVRDSGEHRALASGSRPQWASSGHVVFSGIDESDTGAVPSGTLWALPFDAQRLETIGDPVLVQDGVRVVAGSEVGVALAYLAGDGTLIYVPADTQTDDRTLVWVNRDGTEEEILAEPRRYQEPRVSPDGTRVVMEVAHATGSDLWIYHLAQRILRRLTFAPGIDSSPLWTPDSRGVIFSSSRGGENELYWMPADGTGQAELLHQAPERTASATSWSPDGGTLLLSEFAPATTAYDIGQLSMQGERRWALVLQEDYNEYRPVVSPDGRWLAYETNEDGWTGIYIRSFPNVNDEKVGPISAGSHARWSTDGSELFYRTRTAMMSVRVTTEPRLEVDAPETLFEDTHLYRFANQDYDLAPDGRFLMINGVDSATSTDMGRQIIVERDWVDGLMESVPIP